MITVIATGTKRERRRRNVLFLKLNDIIIHIIIGDNDFEKVLRVSDFSQLFQTGSLPWRFQDRSANQLEKLTI